MKTVKNIIYIEEDGVEVASSDFNSMGDITVSSISEVEKLGQKKPVQPILPSKNGVAVIMFTSGSTGLPKVCVVLCLFSSLCVFVSSAVIMFGFVYLNS